MSPLAILAAVTGAADDETVVAIAADLASRHRSVAVVVGFAPIPLPPVAAPFGGVGFSAEIAQGFNERRQADRARIEALVDRHSRRLGLSPSSEGGAALVNAPVRGSGWANLMIELPLADLTVIGQSSVVGEGAWTGPLGEVLMAARAPVYVARDGVPAAGRPAAIAWDGSLEAGRAIRAALPLLADASGVALLQDPEDLDASRGAQADPDRLIAWMRARGVATECVIKVHGRKIGPTLLRAATEFGAGLLIAGAYHHSRLSEAIFGGATHAFLAKSDGPHLLISH